MKIYTEKWMDIELQQEIRKFLKYCKSYFNITGDLGIYFVNTTRLSRHTFPLLKFGRARKAKFVYGCYTTWGKAFNKPHRFCIFIPVRSFSTLAVLVSLAHELLHWKQYKDNKKTFEEGVDEQAYEIVFNYDNYFHVLIQLLNSNYDREMKEQGKIK